MPGATRARHEVTHGLTHTTGQCYTGGTPQRKGRTMRTTTMTDTVFKGYAGKAEELGREHGLKDRAAYVEDWGHGPEDAQSEDCLHDLPSPLSGEWAGDLTPNELLYTLGLREVHPEDTDELCGIFEEAHNAALFGDN